MGSVNPDVISVGAGSGHGDRRERVVATIVDDIVKGRINGGDRLVAHEIASRIGVSVTPVREALAELAGIGLVDLSPNRGAKVHVFSPREIRDVCRVRRALECEAVRGAVGRIPRGQLEKLDQLFRGLAMSPVTDKTLIAQASNSDSELHDLIARHCGNDFLYRELVRLSRLFRSLRDASWLDFCSRDDCHRLAEEAQEHHQITSALLARDRLRASRAMHSHIAASARYWTRGGSEAKSR
jgi:DNA-binding GntR family transcriptional regulator